MNKEPIRVLHIVTYMGRGGLETMIMNYYRHMDRSKVQFDFLVHRDFEADYDAEIITLGGKIYHLPQLNPFGYQYLSALDAFFREHREYRIVHCHLDCMAGIPLKYAKKHGVPVRIAHVHSSSQDKDVKYPIKMVYKRYIPNYATQLFACSQIAGMWMFGKQEFQLLNNAIDVACYSYATEVRAAVRAELNIRDETLVVGHVGRFDLPKNHKFLLQVFAKLPTKTCLLLVGDGKQREVVQKQAEELGVLDRVRFLGVRSDVARLLQAMDVFVFPSLYEGLGVAVIEAQAAGLPCLISDRVPIECKKTDLVEQVSLATGEKMWAGAILRAAAQPRQHTFYQICDAGYDIHTNALWLQNYYESM